MQQSELVGRRAVELLAEAFERAGNAEAAAAVRRGHKLGCGTPLWMDEALDAIRHALTNDAPVEMLVEALFDAVATMLAVRATIGAGEFDHEAGIHFHRLCGETILRCNAALKARANLFGAVAPTAPVDGEADRPI